MFIKDLIVKVLRIKIVAQFIKFGLVGVLNTLITLASSFILMYFGVSYVAANVIGYILGVINSFIWNRLWTFKSTSSILRDSVPFFIVFAICYGLQLGVLVFLKEVMGVSKWWSTIIGNVFFTIINFLANKFFTFKS